MSGSLWRPPPPRLHDPPELRGFNKPPNSVNPWATPPPWKKDADRPNNLPGMTRFNAPSKPVDPTMLARAVGGLKSFLGVGGVSGANGVPGSLDQPFFPPGPPPTPTAQGAIGRRMDYPSNYNINFRPRSFEPISFDILRAISDPSVGGYDMIRLAIETRKDQMSQLEWSVLPRKKNREPMRPKSDDRCQKAENLLRCPDGQWAWQQWCSQLVEEHLVTDAPAIFRHRSFSGETTRLELMDGATLVPKLNYDGRRPHEGVAYQQNLKGLPAIDYTRENLLYAPRNPRVHKVYGYSCVEQILVTVNIGLRRQAGQLAFFTDGTIPDAIASVPEAWQTHQIQEYQAYWDNMVNDAVTRRKMKFVPAGTMFQQTRKDDALVDAFDEWLARVVAYCFSLPATPFVKMQNRATAESAYETALSEGLQPLMIWLKGIIDYILANWLETPDLELVWDDVKKPDVAEMDQRNLLKQEAGVISIDDIRADDGMEALGIEPFVRGLGPLGFMSISSMKKAIENGWDLTGIPQPTMDPAGAGMPGDPAQLGDMTQGDPLEGLPPEILEALGLPPSQPPGQPAIAGPDQSGQQPMNLRRAIAAPQVAGQEPGSNVVPIHKHPAIQLAMKHGDATAKRMAARMGGASP